MKTTLLILPLAIVAALLARVADRPGQFATTCVTAVRHQTVWQQNPIYYCSPMLTNRPLDYANLSIASWGTLTMVGGNPETAEVENVPFRVYLRRDGKIVHSGASDTTRAVTTIDVVSVLSIAKLGDDLVIEPIRKSDASARRSIKLKTILFNYNLLWFPRKGDGC